MLLMVFIFLSVNTIAATPGDTSTRKSVFVWLGENWAVVAVVLSETMSFLPIKAKGILQGICNVIEAIVKKK
jgi:hypothetical protein